MAAHNTNKRILMESWRDRPKNFHREFFARFRKIARLAML
jgi:hypothetical protein